MACPAAAHVEAIRARNDRDNRWRKLLRCALAAALFVAATTGITMLAPSTALAQVEFSSARRGDVVQFSADEAHRFADGTADVWVLNGHCQINQGPLTTRSRSAVLCIHREDNSPRGRNLVNVYLEGKVAIYEQTPDGISPVAALPAAGGWTGSGESPAAAGQLPAATPKLRAETWVGNLFSDQEPQVRIGRLVDGTQPVLDLYSRAVAAREPTQGQVVRTAEFAIAPAAPTAVGAPPPGTRRLRAFPRSDVRVQAEWFPDTASNEWVAVISGGVNLIIDGADKLGSIDISTDRLVIWTRGMEQPDLGGQTVQRDDTPLEVYMEGNIVFRQADRVVTAKAMYYDVRNHVGMILDAELLGTVQKFEGKLRLQASVLRQTAQDRFVAQGARFTTSRMGEPGYWIQGENLEIQDHPQPAVNPITGEATVDPRTGQPLIEHDWQMTASDDYLFVEGLPVFYWPTLTTDLDDPGFYLKQIKFKSDNVFGQQIWTDWNPYQLLGFKKPIKGTTWDLGFDYLSDRGPAVSTKYTYTFPSLAGLGGPTKGVLDAFYIHDDGVDNLGRDYRAVVPSTTERGRLLYNNRQSLGDGFEWIGELGIVSDRNFLQQYYQREWWTSKDEDTDLRIRRSVENRSWTVMGQMQLEHFFTTTSWLPRADHYWIGESILGDHFTWFEHSSAAYAQYRPETIPPNEPAFQLLPWQVASTGSRFSSRQEIDLPVDIGVVKVVPYALGELTHWGEDLNGQPLDRAYGQVGIRANLPMWKVDPTVESDLWNVHGLAHKVDFQAQFSYSDANQDVTQLPLYDPIDDDSIEQFRNFYPFYDFPGGTIPSQFDPRFYAIRAGLADWVTSPSTELADDLTALRLGVHQRWQTKRGEPGAQHIVDWITFDTDLVLYPNQNQDNFGALVGLIDYNFSWHVGDRFTLLSEGLFDTFSQGQQLVSVGGLLHRPDLGSVYLGVQSLEGPISSQVLIATINYRMSEKWITSFTTSLSIGGSTNTTQQLTFTRIGESFLVKLGVYSDEGQGTFGAKLAIEPRFFRSAAHNQIDGIHVPPAGALGTLD